MMGMYPGVVANPRERSAAPSATFIGPWPILPSSVAAMTDSTPASTPPGTPPAPQMPAWLYWTVLAILSVVLVVSGIDWLGAADRGRRASALSTFANAAGILVLFLPRVLRVSRGVEGILVVAACALLGYAAWERWQTGSPVVASLLAFLGAALVGAFLMRGADGSPGRGSGGGHEARGG